MSVDGAKAQRRPTKKCDSIYIRVYVSALSVLNPASPSPSPYSAYKTTLLPLNKNHLPVFFPPFSPFLSVHF